jgi:hypothetical protein
LNTHAGTVTNAAVAEAHGLTAGTIEAALAQQP